MNIVIDKDEINSCIELLKPELNKSGQDMFFLEEEIPFKHLSTQEEGSITNLPFWYDGCGYYIIYRIVETEGRLGNATHITEWLNHITHVNISCNHKYWYTVINGKGYWIYGHHFCNSLNYTARDKHFGNEGLIKATLSYNIRQQNPSDAYFNADRFLKLFTDEKALMCARCNKPIKADANPIERVLRRHLVCNQDISNLQIANYTYCSDSYIPIDNLPDDSNKVYKNITKEELQDALKNLRIDTDYTMVGCGSAGSNIAYQLSKTSLLNNCVLYDDDCIECKNLRNTAYDIGCTMNNKVRELRRIITANNEDRYLKQVITRQEKYNPETDIYNNKYVFNVVDSLTTRLQVAENATYRYIIDTRFKGLNCGIYIIDRENEKEYNYYMNSLKQSIKDYVEDVRVEKENITPEIARSFRFICHEWECASKLRKRSDKWYKELPLDQKEALLKMLDESRRTCNSPNIIDIYTIMAGIVVSAIRNIENGKDKPFSHLEISTENGLLQQMVVVK